MSGLLWLAEKMRDDVLAEIEIKIDFRAPPMGVRREGIPDISRLQRGESHDELATLDTALVDEFVDRACVARLLSTEAHGRSLAGFHHPRWMRRMRGTGQKIELRGILGVRAFEGNRLGAHGQVDAVQGFQGEQLSVGDHPPLSSDIDGPQLAAFQKERATGFLVVRQINGLLRGHHTTHYKAVEIGEMGHEFAGHEQVLNLKGVAQVLRRQADDIAGMRSAEDIIIYHMFILVF